MLTKEKKNSYFSNKYIKILGKALFSIFVIVLSTVFVLFSQVIEWMFDTWKNLTMSELMYQLNAPVEGTNKDIIIDGIYRCVPGTVLVFMLVVVLMVGLRKYKRGYLNAGIFVLVASIIYFSYFANMMWTRLDISHYMKNRNSTSSFIDNNYVDPEEVEIKFPKEKRNLIYIFLESMETTYAGIEEGGAFEAGCISELVQLAQENEDFSGETEALNGANVMPYATWTMAGIFAQTSGIPLILPIDGNSMDMQETFFPTLTTIGDILNDEGYNQVFYIGSEAIFGGRRLYLTEHGNYEMKDYYYAIEKGRIPNGHYVWWGYEDKYLFEYAKDELLELVNQNEPFNFTMLTVDTHFENGYVCSDCGTEHGGNQYANVMSCSSRKIKEFVEWIQKQDFYENTTIVLCGDHLTMDGDFCEGINSDYVRKTYTAYINSAIEPEETKWTREYTTFDHYPTTLASLGVKIEGNRLGLGTNLFSSRPTILEEYGIDYVVEEVQKDSELMTELASTVDTENDAIRAREGR